MAAEVDETSATALAQIAAAKEIGDSEGLIALAASDSIAWQTSPLLAGKVAERSSG
jgi:hypothetical protein